MKTDQATTKYKRYDASFKHSAVEHWMLSGKSARIIAGEPGINEQSLHKWKQQFKALPASQVIAANRSWRHQHVVAGIQGFHQPTAAPRKARPHVRHAARMPVNARDGCIWVNRKLKKKTPPSDRILQPQPDQLTEGAGETSPIPARLPVRRASLCACWATSVHS